MKSRVSPTGSYLFRVQKKRDLQKNNSRISHNTQISLQARAVVRLSLRHVEIRETRVDSLLRSLMMVSTSYGVSSHATRARDRADTRMSAERVHVLNRAVCTQSR